MNEKKYFGFTLLELIFCLGILLTLISLILTLSPLIKKKIRFLESRHTLSIIQQALLMYKKVSGHYPWNEKASHSHVLFEALTSPIDIKDHQGHCIKKLNPILDNRPLEENPSITPLEKSGLILKESSGSETRFFFKDAWGNKILYYFGPISKDHPYARQDSYFNINWAYSEYDLISFGPDRLSESTATQKDDIKNF